MTTKRAILFTTFGSTRKEALTPMLKPLLGEASSRWPDRQIQVIYTGEQVRRVRKEQGEEAESLQEALGRLAEEGYKDVTVQPLMVNHGGEYEKIRREVRELVSKEMVPVKIRLGRPLLWDHKDMEGLKTVLEREADQDSRDRITVYVAHGTGGTSDENLRLLERKLQSNGRILVAALKGRYGLDVLEERLKEQKEKAVALKSLMLMAGVHVTEDLAGEGEHAWKERLKALGYTVDCELMGLGELPEIRAMFMDHAEEAVLIRRNTNPLEALVLAKNGMAFTECSNSLGLDEGKILACREFRQALMIQELQAQELFPDCELEILEGALDDILAMIDGENTDGESDYGGVITSYGDLEFFGLKQRARAIFTPEEILPGIDAGSVNFIEGAAKQGFLYELELGPEAITSVYAEGDEDGLELWGLYYSEETGQWWTHWMMGDPEDPMASGREFARQIQSGGQWDMEEWDEEEE